MLVFTSLTQDHGIDAMGNLSTASGPSRHSAIKMSAILCGCIVVLGIRATGQPATNATNLLPMCEQRQELSADMLTELRQIEEEIIILMEEINEREKRYKKRAHEMKRLFNIDYPKQAMHVDFQEYFRRRKAQLAALKKQLDLLDVLVQSNYDPMIPTPHRNSSDITTNDASKRVVAP